MLRLLPILCWFCPMWVQVVTWAQGMKGCTSGCVQHLGVRYAVIQGASTWPDDQSEIYAGILNSNYTSRALLTEWMRIKRERHQQTMLYILGEWWKLEQMYICTPAYNSPRLNFVIFWIRSYKLLQNMQHSAKVNITNICQASSKQDNIFHFRVFSCYANNI